MSDEWCVDATMGYRGGFCCCPIERNEDGSIQNIVVGMNFIGNPPGKLVCIVHEDGDEAVERFYAAHKGEIDALFAANRAKLVTP